MTETTPGAAGWYPSPDDDRVLRYWDGQRWTRKYRPRPVLADEPSFDGRDRVGRPEAMGTTTQPRRRRLQWPMVVVLLGFVVVGFLGYVTWDASRRPPSTIDDPAWVERANELCGERIDAIRPPRTEGDPPPNAEVADGADRAADQLQALGRDLRTIPARPEDRPEIDAWLLDWDAYAAVGHRYADAVRAGDRDAWLRVSEESEDEARRINRFARANKVDSCSFVYRSPGSSSPF